jgi:hypothetical protein
MNTTPTERRPRGRPRKVQPIVQAEACPENPVVKKPVGRPKTVHNFHQILSMAHLMSDAEIRKQFGISYRTWMRYLEKNGGSEALYQARVKGSIAIRKAIYARALAGDCGAARLYGEWSATSRKGGRKKP